MKDQLKVGGKMVVGRKQCGLFGERKRNTFYKDSLCAIHYRLIFEAMKNYHFTYHCRKSRQFFMCAQMYFTRQPETE
jgi:hypothetical protein